MLPSTDTSRVSENTWVYASLRVRDGDRLIKPSSVGPDEISFRQPPRLTSSQVEIIITNGNEVQRGMAEILPHDPNDTEIPIRLVTRIT